MHTAQFIKLVSVAGWLWVSQGNLVRSEQVGLIAQSSACQVDRLTAEDLSTSGTPTTSLTGTVFITITCPSGVGGTLNLILNPTVVYNGGVRSMGFINNRVTGALASVSTTASPNPINVVIPAATGVRTGTGFIQVSIATSGGKLLKSANDYKLIVTADFN